MTLREAIEKNSRKLMGISFLFLGVYDSEGKPLLEVGKASYPKEESKKVPYIVFGSIQLFKTMRKAGELGDTVIIEKKDQFYIISRDIYRGDYIYVVYVVEKGWFIFSSVERAIKKARKFLESIKESTDELSGNAKL